ncbi:hypothetical protein LU604_02360 [Erwinia tracheiphila]|uniref:hypothetical protein n=1 Tax=Erwinia tracheiphila TaxID=65700 RepID=UPI001F4654DB|nr:hypothetical protein [Erwinia tracheiphila]UIA83964.1 hypothetical protein LU604_02360 [Erwinia tracheiphila]UIA92546.1 hypothetical protein LU632_02330 [Erwinia tracheiphila]
MQTRLTRADDHRYHNCTGLSLQQHWLPPVKAAGETGSAFGVVNSHSMLIHVFDAE